MINLFKRLLFVAYLSKKKKKKDVEWLWCSRQSQRLLENAISALDGLVPKASSCLEMPSFLGQ
jgi:hypothetical protein